MDWLLVAAGVLLVLVGLLDVFFTVLHYDGFGFLSSRLYNSLFDVVRLDGTPDAEEANDRYKLWLPFAHRNRAFFESSARDLGYELDELAQDPGERLF